MKNKALEKMLKEMEKNHSSEEDIIHNWLCKQSDEILFIGILSPDKSIKGAMTFCKNKAKVFFIRDPKFPSSALYTIEVKNKNIVQIRGKHNQIAPGPVWDAAKAWLG